MDENKKALEQIVRNEVRIQALEQRATERREAEQEIFKKLDEINLNISKLNITSAVLWYKTGVIGLIGGAIPALVTLVILLITGKIPLP